jgi:HEPN domain-containing protein
VNRAELQRLTRDRIRDAKALLTAGRWSGAYYLAGYAVECGLKACIIVQLMKTDQFPERRFSE